MNLSTSQLNALTILLPRIRISHVMFVSAFSSIPFDTLMNIRTAGMKTKIASGEMSEYKFVSQWSGDFLYRLAGNAINQSTPIMEKVIGDRDNSDEILNTITKNFLGTKNNEEATKAVEEYMKEKGFNNVDAKMASDYASLFRIQKGLYNESFTGLITNYAKRLKGVSRALKLSLQDAVADVMAMITTGNYTTQEGDLADDQKDTIQEKGMGLERYIKNMLNQNKIPGAGAFRNGMETIAKATISNVTNKGWQKKKKENETTTKDTQSETTSGSHDLSEEIDVEFEGDDPSEGFMEDGSSNDPKGRDEDKVLQTDIDKAQKRAIKRDQAVKAAVSQNLEKVVRENVPSKKGMVDEDRIRKTIFIYKNALSNPYYTKKELSRASKAGDTPTPESASSNSYFTRDKSAMKREGIENEKDYASLTSGNIKKRIQENIELAIDEAKEQVAKAAGATLSHQLLRTAAAKGKIHMLGMVCAIEPRNCQAGSVMVFERGCPKFAHIFNWNINKGKIRIADIQDIDADHLDDAYQVAFEAIQQEVAINNMEEQMVK